MKTKNLVHNRTTVYNIGCHIVWSVKYRKKILIKQIEKSLKEILYKIAEEKDFIIKEIECDKDHIHIFVSAKPKTPPTYIYKMMKGISARRLFLQYPNLKNKLWGGSLWNPSTYIETIGHISEETVKRYIQEQKIK